MDALITHGYPILSYLAFSIIYFILVKVVPYWRGSSRLQYNSILHMIYLLEKILESKYACQIPIIREDKFKGAT
jgi:uncharacterized membrane protein YkvI